MVIYFAIYACFYFPLWPWKQLQKLVKFIIHIYQEISELWWSKTEWQLKGFTLKRSDFLSNWYVRTIPSEDMTRIFIHHSLNYDTVWLYISPDWYSILIKGFINKWLRMCVFCLYFTHFRIIWIFLTRIYQLRLIGVPLPLSYLTHSSVSLALRIINCWR